MRLYTIFRVEILLHVTNLWWKPKTWRLFKDGWFRLETPNIGWVSTSQVTYAPGKLRKAELCPFALLATSFKIWRPWFVFILWKRRTPNFVFWMSAVFFLRKTLFYKRFGPKKGRAILPHPCRTPCQNSTCTSSSDTHQGGNNVDNQHGIAFLPWKNWDS